MGKLISLRSDEVSFESDVVRLRFCVAGLKGIVAGHQGNLVSEAGKPHRQLADELTTPDQALGEERTAG